jgi:hypothetical protein
VKRTGSILIRWGVLLLGVLAGLGPAGAERIWWDGSTDAENAPPGKLLSDNEGYWGECVLTGVTYRYETEPDAPADTWRDQKERFGRRLLDGIPQGNWWVPVGVNPGRPLVVIFDFQRRCTFAEVDVCTRSKQVALKLETSDAPDGGWQPVFERSREACPEQVFHRLPLPERPQGRYLRLTVQAEGVTYLEEVLAWGDAEVSAETPEAFNPVTPTPVIQGISFPSVPGIERTTVSDAEVWEWRRALGAAAKVPAVWSRVPTWDSITDRPLLPKPAQLARQVVLTMARNETECVALALTNTAMEQPVTLPVTLGVFRAAGARTPAAGITGKLRVAGAIGSRQYGVGLGPLLERGNLPGASLMRRYLTNAAGIQDFPRVTLSPAGSAVFWLSVTTKGAKPGRYEARLTYQGGQPVVIRVEVLDVTLPAPFVWVNSWSGTTTMFPFVYGDRKAREVAYKQSLGITVWNGFPTPGSEAALARQGGRAIFHTMGMPRTYVDRGYNNQIQPEELTAQDEQAIAEHVRSLVAQAKALGLSYDDWYAELWDEPGRRNSPLYGALAGMIRKADPKVRIYCNPCFWEGNGVAPDDVVTPPLQEWYRERVDISVPLFLLMRDHPRAMRLFSAPRFVNAFYTVSTQSAKSERAAQVELYRRLAWDAASQGWNGWGFYSYYAPRGNPWSDFDQDWAIGEDLPDYQMVYPGPRGPIPTRASEAVREGWEDYCLLHLLRQRGLKKEVDALLKAYAAGRPLPELRLRALKAAAGRR